MSQGAHYWRLHALARLALQPARVPLHTDVDHTVLPDMSWVCGLIDTPGVGYVCVLAQGVQPAEPSQHGGLCMPKLSISGSVVASLHALASSRRLVGVRLCMRAACTRAWPFY